MAFNLADLSSWWFLTYTVKNAYQYVYTRFAVTLLSAVYSRINTRMPSNGAGVEWRAYTRDTRYDMHGACADRETWPYENGVVWSIHVGKRIEAYILWSCDD